MVFSQLGLAVSLIALAGCANLGGATALPPVPWHDTAFGHSPGLVDLDQEQLFLLDPELEQQLAAPAVQQLSTAKRIEKLIGLLYGQGIKPFPYQAGHSTRAAETWRNGRGDCLSLTVLAYAMARALHLQAQMQEVHVPVMIDRRGDVDYFNEHINLVFPKSAAGEWIGNKWTGNDLVLDFEPDLGSNRKGQTLSASDVLARYDNNRASEHLAQRQFDQAYAYFKAAITQAPGYPASYGNMALLYVGRGWLADAEQLLRRAIQLSEDPSQPMLSLQQLLEQQGRSAEARQVALDLQSRRDQNPYFWVGLGLQRLRDGQPHQAIAALEQAEQLTHGFEEVHHYLALAYWKTGEMAQVEAQLQVLSQINPNSADLAALREKLMSARLR